MEFKLPFFDLLEQIPLVVVMERGVAAQQDVRNDSNRPHIDRFA
jgi:hypothetical protein